MEIGKARKLYFTQIISSRWGNRKKKGDLLDLIKSIQLKNWNGMKCIQRTISSSHSRPLMGGIYSRKLTCNLTGNFWVLNMHSMKKGWDSIHLSVDPHHIQIGTFACKVPMIIMINYRLFHKKNCQFPNVCYFFPVPVRSVDADAFDLPLWFLFGLFVFSIASIKLTRQGRKLRLCGCFTFTLFSFDLSWFL